ncbi:MAG TPA: class I SAM-dependent methyltransferase [Polyangiaceae bacterium]|nr:class I SAM-dependent methyltransferase [Polyangiaceae bacterium]
MTPPAPPPRPPFFEAVAGRYDRAYALPTVESRRRMERVLAALPPAPLRVLDLGVGTGRELTALLDAGLAPVGVDASPAMLARCERRARPVPLVLADFWEPPLPFDEASFDAAIALHGTLAHPPDAAALQALSRELARLVCKGGVFVGEVPHPGWLDTLGDGDLGDRRIRRTGLRTCVCEDLVARASIEARLFNADEWVAAFGAQWETRVEPLGALEWFVVARRV